MTNKFVNYRVWYAYNDFYTLTTMLPKDLLQQISGINMVTETNKLGLLQERELVIGINVNKVLQVY